jgi:hypothetical protein
MGKQYVNVSNTNSKLGAAILSINLPAGTTCRADAPCKKGCYALKGNWLFPNVKNSLQENLEAYKNNPKLYFESVAAQTALARFVRWHSAGDIINAEYFEGMCKVARKNKGTHYLCFTKKYEIVNEFLAKGKRIPKNLSVVFSAWSNWIPENPYNMPMTYVYGKDFENELIPKDSIPCTGKCYECQACWTLKKGQNVYFKKH